MPMLLPTPSVPGIKRRDELAIRRKLPRLDGLSVPSQALAARRVQEPRHIPFTSGIAEDC